MAGSQSTSKPQPGPEGGENTALVRALKVAVIGMGVLIVVGLATVIGRIVYLASSTEDTPPPLSSPRSKEQTLALPSGAEVRTMTLFGPRLAVQYQSPTGSGITILDIATGEIVSHIRIVPEDRP